MLLLLLEKKKLRNTTSEKSKAVEQRDKQREARAKMLKEMAAQKRVSEVRRLTQEELLEEAKITEEENMTSLGECTGLLGSRIKSVTDLQQHSGFLDKYHAYTYLKYILNQS